MFRRTLISTVSFVSIVAIWYFGIIYPPRKAAKSFLTALKTRNQALLENSVSPTELETYYNLYMRNGFNKHLKSYRELKKINSTPFPLPRKVVYKLEVDEEDQFFGTRRQKYKLLVHRFADGWRVLRFSSEHDAEDLKILRRMGYAADSEKTGSAKDKAEEGQHKAIPKKVD